MKQKWTIKLVFLSAMILLLYSCSQNNNNYKQTEFYVRGNCGMCEERIETTIKKVDGIIAADWNVETKNISVTYDSLKIDEGKIQQTIANTGHETKTVASPQAVHDALPECCKKGSSM